MVISLLLAASACLLCAWLHERIGSALALLAALMFGLNPYSVILTGLLHYDILHIFLLIAGSWTLHRALVEARPARLLLAGVVDRIDTVEHKVYVDRTKYQIKDAPEYDQTADDAQYRERLGNYYAETYNGLDTRT